MALVVASAASLGGAGGCPPAATTLPAPTAPAEQARGEEASRPVASAPASSEREVAAPTGELTFTNRGFTDEPGRSDSHVALWTDLPTSREAELAPLRAIHERLPALFACMRRASETAGFDSSLHVRFLVRSGAIETSAEPDVEALTACLGSAIAGVEASGFDRYLGTFVMIHPRYARVLEPVAPSDHTIRGLGGCHVHHAQRCGPADDCPLDAFLPGLCSPTEPARLELQIDGAPPALRAIVRLGADDEPTYVAALPFPLPMDSSSPRIALLDDAPLPDLPGYVGVARGEVVALVGTGGTVVVDRTNGSIRLVEPPSPREDLGWDDATGEVRIGRTRCPIERGRTGRAAVACGNRIVLVRGATHTVVLDERGAVVARGELEADDVRGTSVRYGGRVGLVDVTIEGRVYVR